MPESYDVVMSESKNPLQRLPKTQRFQVMVFLSVMWTTVFYLAIGSYGFWGELVLGHVALATGVLIKPASGASAARFTKIVSRTILVLEDAPHLNPVPFDGPEVHWPSSTIALQSRIASRIHPAWWRGVCVVAATALAWLVFTLNIRVGGFDASRYRREIAVNTDLLVSELGFYR